MLSAADKRTLWAAADKLRTNMDAAEYKHIVLGLIFLKYVSDAFTGQRDILRRRFADSKDEYHIDDAALIEKELEDRDYYRAANVFWVPEAARWETLQNAARQPDIGKRIDDALDAIEKDNPPLKGLLDKRFARTQLPTEKLGELIDLIATVGFGAGEAARDVLGEVYEYFLGQFASAEGKKGGQFYTPESVVKVLVEVLAPHEGRVYDPCCGSGGMFVQSEKFVESHRKQNFNKRKRRQEISIYGQESNYTTWRLVGMNLVIRGLDFNLGREAADSFLNDQHPDLRADFVLANPPFNVSDWWHPRLEGDARWLYGTPPQGNANYAWLQHILHHLAPTGRAGVVLANGSMSSNQGGEGEIRRRVLEADVVECMVALPPQLFFNTQIPACLWFLARDKSGAGGKTDRRGQVLFIDARQLGRLENRVHRVFDDEEIVERIGATYRAWRGDGETKQAYADVPGFCKSAELKDIKEHDYILTPGRYVGAEVVEDDETAFAEKMAGLVAELRGQFEQSDALEAEIKRNMERLGYEA